MTECVGACDVFVVVVVFAIANVALVFARPLQSQVLRISWGVTLSLQPSSQSLASFKICSWNEEMLHSQFRNFAFSFRKCQADQSACTIIVSIEY